MLCAQPAALQYEAILDLSSAWAPRREHPGRPILSSAALSIEHDSDRWGFRLKAGAGELFRSTVSADPWKGPNTYLAESYFSLKPLAAGPVRLDAGKFNAAPGAEPPEAVDNFNYTRSLLSALAYPAYHFGVRGSVQITSRLTAGAALINGWNNVIDNNRGKTLSLKGAWTGKAWSWSHAFLYGPERGGQPYGRSLYDTYLTHKFRWPVSAYLEYSEGCDHLPGFADQPWRGVSAAAQWQAGRRWMLAQRGGWFADPYGAASGQARDMGEMTFTADFRPHPLLVWRAEYRRDWERPAEARTRTGSNTYLTALMFFFRGER